MPRNRVTARRAAVVVAGLVLLTGCGGDDDGPPTAASESPSTDPTPGPTLEPTQEPTSAPTSAAPAETGPAGDAGLAALDPCAMVDAAGAGSLGLTGGEAETLGEARVCRYRFEGPTLNESFTVSVELFETYGPADIVATDVQALAPIGDHEAVTFTGTTGGCVVSLGVSETSRLDATAVGGDPALACEHATQLAALAEPALP
ncbi:DUF3558 family protein [Jiangella endophytica]|uniref:DUF3558 family protein n=1 Tax=Jiangella endophytica TaxID=1623398 RepID=UPI0013006746|nr:DUF3558 family protein [Jiangella endophytica]